MAAAVPPLDQLSVPLHPLAVSVMLSPSQRAVAVEAVTVGAAGAGRIAMGPALQAVGLGKNFIQRPLPAAYIFPDGKMTPVLTCW